MITFPHLGEMGRLGNQLFQMAATIALATDHRDAYGFPSWWPYQGRFPIAACFHKDLGSGPLYDHAAWLPYEPIPYRPNLRLKGYFQSEKYFARHAKLIRSLLTPRSCIPGVHGRVASVHVRRGDYVQFPTLWPNLGMDYYGRAAELLSGKVDSFHVYSDDPEWCRAAFKDRRFVIMHGEDHQDLGGMISCAHHIIANSTFSWWGAWLNPSPDKVVIAPRTWFGPDMGGFKTDDLFPEGWIVI